MTIKLRRLNDNPHVYYLMRLFKNPVTVLNRVVTTGEDEVQEFKAFPLVRLKEDNPLYKEDVYVNATALYSEFYPIGGEVGQIVRHNANYTTENYFTGVLEEAVDLVDNTELYEQAIKKTRGYAKKAGKSRNRTSRNGSSK